MLLLAKKRISGRSQQWIKIPYWLNITYFTKMKSISNVLK